MMLPVLFLAAGAGLAWRGTMELRTHGHPRVQINDPEEEDSTEGTSGRSWLAGTMFVAGLLILTAGSVMVLRWIETDWIRLLLAAGAVVVGAVIDLRATMLLMMRYPERRFPLYFEPRWETTETWILRLCGLVAITVGGTTVQNTTGLGAMFIVVLAVWLLPGMGVRYAHNKRLGTDR